MRKLPLLLLLTLLFVFPALAEDTQTIRCTGFSLELPAAWAVDVDEYTKTDYPIVSHILHPAMIFAEDEEYALVVTLYNHTSDNRYKLAGKGDRAQEHFNLIAEHSGLTAAPAGLSSRVVKSLRDIRNFVICRIPGKNAHLATYFNQEKGQGYVFQLTRKADEVTAEAAESLLLEIVSSLREDGHFYPEDASDRKVVITHTSAHIRTSADAEGERIKTAAQGESFPYYGQTGSWYIINVNGVTGYVSTALSELQ